MTQAEQGRGKPFEINIVVHISMYKELHEHGSRYLAFSSKYVNILIIKKIEECIKSF